MCNPVSVTGGRYIIGASVAQLWLEIRSLLREGGEKFTVYTGTRYRVSPPSRRQRLQCFNCTCHLTCTTDGASKHTCTFNNTGQRCKTWFSGITGAILWQLYLSLTKLGAYWDTLEMALLSPLFQCPSRQWHGWQWWIYLFSGSGKSLFIAAVQQRLYQHISGPMRRKKMWPTVRRGGQHSL